VAIGLWAVLATGAFARSFALVFELVIRPAFAPPSTAFHLVVRRLIPILGFYEFAIVVLAIAGSFAIVSRRAGDRFAAWSIAWAIASIATLASIAANSADSVLAIELPLMVAGAYAVEWIAQSERWSSIRYAVAAGVALSLYVQIVTNFVYPAPDTSEAPWRRHALLFWSDPATSIQTVKACDRVRDAVSPAGASAMVPDDAPQVQWYLRDFELTDSPDGASIVVTIGKTQSGALAGDPDSPQFGFEEWWTPDFHALTVARAIAYFFTERAWSEVEIRDLGIATPKAGGDSSKPKP